MNKEILSANLETVKNKYLQLKGQHRRDLMRIKLKTFWLIQHIIVFVRITWRMSKLKAPIFPLVALLEYRKTWHSSLI